MASESESETRADEPVEEESFVSNVPDRPLGVTLRTRKIDRKGVEGSDSDDL